MTHPSAIARRSLVDLRQLGLTPRSQAVTPAPDYGLFALLPDGQGMLKARLPARRRTDPAVPVALTIALAAKLVQHRPRRAVPVLFRKAAPAWTQELLGLVADYRRGQVRFFANGLLCHGHWCGFPG